MGKMRALSPQHGDLVLEWDVTDKASVAEAIAGFEQQMAEGKMAFEHDRATNTDTQVRKFNKKAEEILFVSPLQGG